MPEKERGSVGIRPADRQASGRPARSGVGRRPAGCVSTKIPEARWLAETTSSYAEERRLVLDVRPAPGGDRHPRGAGVRRVGGAGAHLRQRPPRGCVVVLEVLFGVGERDGLDAAAWADPCGAPDADLRLTPAQPGVVALRSCRPSTVPSYGNPGCAPRSNRTRRGARCRAVERWAWSAVQPGARPAELALRLSPARRRRRGMDAFFGAALRRAVLHRLFWTPLSAPGVTTRQALADVGELVRG